MEFVNRFVMLGLGLGLRRWRVKNLVCLALFFWQTLFARASSFGLVESKIEHLLDHHGVLDVVDFSWRGRGRISSNGFLGSLFLSPPNIQIVLRAVTLLDVAADVRGKGPLGGDGFEADKAIKTGHGAVFKWGKKAKEGRVTVFV